MQSAVCRDLSAARWNLRADRGTGRREAGHRSQGERGSNHRRLDELTESTVPGSPLIAP